jgi:hypothetical protein
MTSLDEKAESDDGIEVLLASDAAGVYRLQDDELTSHKNIRETGQFPQYGEFLACNKVRAADGEFIDGEDVWLECPAALANGLVHRQVEPATVFAVSEPQKSMGGRWSFSVTVPENVDDLL